MSVIMNNPEQSLAFFVFVYDVSDEDIAKLQSTSNKIQVITIDKADIEKYNKEFLDDPALQTLNAVKEKRFFYPREGYIYNSSQDIVFGVQEVARAAYGELFSQPENCHISVAEIN